MRQEARPSGPRVAPRCIGAPHEHAQHLCHRVLSMACPGFLTVPQGGMSAPPAIVSRAAHTRRSLSNLPAPGS
jgi:hypothetical protein